MLRNAVRPLLGLAIAGFLAMSSLVLGVAAPAFACSCKIADVEEHGARADEVFVGDVTAVKKDFKYSVTVTRSYKGTVAGRTTVASRDDCGFNRFKKGKDYVFFANGTSAPYVLKRCSGSMPANDEQISEVEAVLVAGPTPTTTPEPDPPAPTMTKVEQSAPASVGRLAAPGAAMVLAGLLGLFVVRRLSRR